MAVKQGYINHVGLVLDASSSMGSLKSATIKVADLQVNYLAERSKQMDQETRATVYQFDQRVECVYYDKDVLRLPSIAQTYKIGGQTALIDAVLQSIEDLGQTATLYGDHAFLIYVLTDGQENASKQRPDILRRKLQNLPDNWTIAVFVPDQSGVFEAKNLGFAPGNIQVWETSDKGIKEVGETIRRTTDAYMTARTTGIRSTAGLFQLGVMNLTPHTVEHSLDKVNPLLYDVLKVNPNDPISIKEFVEFWTRKKYQKGKAFYQLTKSEEVQAQKQICVREKGSGYLYEGVHARQIIGLPDYSVRVAPATHPKYDIFIQSTSVNRKLVPGTQVIVF